MDCFFRQNSFSQNESVIGGQITGLGDKKLLQELKREEFEGYLLGKTIDHMKAYFDEAQWSVVEKKSK